MKYIITEFKTGEVRKTSKRVSQWDYGQMLVIRGLDLPEYYEVHFCDEGDKETITMTGSAKGVRVPENLLKTEKDIFAYVYLHQEEDDGETEYIVRIPVVGRPKPSDIEPEPAEQTVISQLIEEMNDATNRSEAAKRESEAWAVGTRGGEPVDPEDETYRNNSKFYAEAAGQSAEDAQEAVENVEETVRAALKEAKDSGEFDGPAGPQGIQGPRGDTGATGPQGPKGDPGEVTQAEFDDLADEVGDLKSAFTESLLHKEEIENTVQTITFDQSGNVQSITHTRNESAVRTDVFTFGAGTITEVRTLSTGESLTIVTNTATLETTVTYAAA